MIQGWRRIPRKPFGEKQLLLKSEFLGKLKIFGQGKRGFLNVGH